MTTETKPALKLADDTLPYSDFGHFKTIEIIDPRRPHGDYIWIGEVIMRVESGTNDQSFRMAFTISPEQREEIIRRLQDPTLRVDPPSPDEARRIEEAYRRLNRPAEIVRTEVAQPVAIPRQSWWRRLLSYGQ